ncbi:DUF6894 family protein [Microvirga aerilata]|jgi:hypothetical protein|uniref:DUF6894 family protein n=1 Tax=Microvirga aerilata TaxID=670292 RepID=UPI0035E43D30
MSMTEDRVHPDEGSEFDSLDAAVQSALTSAGEISRSLLGKGDTGGIVNKVKNEHTQQVCTVAASMRIDCHAAPPR